MGQFDALHIREKRDRGMRMLTCNVNVYLYVILITS